MRLCALFICIAVAGCTEFPELEARETEASRNADYPSLIPLDGQAAPVVTDTTIAGADTLRARADALRNRTR